MVAVKIINLEEAEDDLSDIQKEIAVLAQCRSPHVTAYHGSSIEVMGMFVSMCTRGFRSFRRGFF
jgi:serine/threonine-protein kinase 24/25/MST4